MAEITNDDRRYLPTEESFLKKDIIIKNINSDKKVKKL